MAIESVVHTHAVACLDENEQHFRPFELCALIPVPYICSVTNNRIIMKKTKDSKFNELSIDVVEYMFIEWLCRRGVFSAFRSNYDLTKPVNVSFRNALRRHIRYVFSASHLSIGALVSSSFVFVGTPEGRDFWSGVSSDWRRFCIDFQKLF